VLSVSGFTRTRTSAQRDHVRSKHSNVHETMGDVLYAPNGCGKTLRVKCGPCNVVLRLFGMLFPRKSVQPQP
jgi:hypothetical protein